jgi:hypothetical protein
MTDPQATLLLWWMTSYKVSNGFVGNMELEELKGLYVLKSRTRQRRDMPGQWQRTGSPWICIISFINLTNNNLINIQKTHQPNARDAIFPDNNNAPCSLEASSNDEQCNQHLPKPKMA